MTKYNKDMVQACADWVRKNGLIDFGGATLTDFCKAMGIEDQTYYRWLDKVEFVEAIKKERAICPLLLCASILSIKTPITGIHGLTHGITLLHCFNLSDLGFHRYLET